MREIFLLFIMKYAYIFVLHAFLTNLTLLLKYLEINIRLAETNTAKELIVTPPAFRNFVVFLFYHLRNFSYFHLLVQHWIIFFIIEASWVVLSPRMAFSLLCFSLLWAAIN